MTVNELIDILKPLEGNAQIVFKPDNSHYIEAFANPGTITAYRLEKREITSFYGENCNFNAYVLLGRQIGSV